MRVLLIDDLRTVEPLEGAQISVARTAAEGLALLKDEEWDLLLLDHDLGETDIRPVVAYLEEKAFLGARVPIGRVIVVSSNPPGAAWIAQGLKRHYDLQVSPAGRSITLHRSP